MISDTKQPYESIVYRMNDGVVLQITVGELKTIIEIESRRCYACHTKMLSDRHGGFCSVKCNNEFHDGFWDCERVMKK